MDDPRPTLAHKPVISLFSNIFHHKKSIIQFKKTKLVKMVLIVKLVASHRGDTARAHGGMRQCLEASACGSHGGLAGAGVREKSGWRY
ncbi:hypothetical protein FKD06_16715 [Serratia sp. SRS-8-S-2018]|uniref:hypothetical protein n=1 Tax=Serratia sp. SRS-8-S-2018 TaxID=2591107 RepID=UPI00114018B3|nr:hypothetical protein [Serratia sp. SRS-8-S-2018]TPW46848.1 hypothetical protein FKD06_16715 [Serratia sp. SRS-8-S-2018]